MVETGGHYQGDNGEPPQRGGPHNQMLQAVNRALLDPEIRESIRRMFSEGYPFIRMVEDLGLEDDMTANIRELIEQLPADTVGEIRSAVLDSLDRGEYRIPVHCTGDSWELQASHADVDVIFDNGRATILVRLTRDEGS